MNRVFLDTNVVVDFLCERGDFYMPAASIVVKAYRKEIELCCSALTYTTASYLMERGKVKREDVFLKLADFSSLCTPTIVDKNVIEQALKSKFTDFEDAVQYFSAKQFGATIIITRNKQDFTNSAIPCQTPIEFLDCQ